MQRVRSTLILSGVPAEMPNAKPNIFELDKVSQQMLLSYLTLLLYLHDGGKNCLGRYRPLGFL